MNDETKIKLQAFLDGELSGQDAAEISGLLDKDAEAKSFFAELQFVKAALRDNEPEIKLSESREFYWGKIQREIERAEKSAQVKPGLAWWKPAYVRFAAGFAALCAVLMISFIAFDSGSSAKLVPEVEGNGEEMGVITYHSDAERMTVVYLFDREQDKVVDSDTNF
jgi:anti-sigma factor RsiW